MKESRLVKHTGNDLVGQLQARLAELVPSGVVRAVRVVEEGLTAELVSPSGQPHRLRILVRALAAPSRLRDAAHRARQLAGGDAPVLASRFLSPRARAILQEEGIGYLDLAGNCRLALPELHLERVVEENPFPAHGRPASLFSPISSRIVRALLEEPQRAWQISELAREAGASLGQSSSVCRRLRDEAYATLDQRRLRLAQPGALLDAWQPQSALAKPRRLLYYSFERSSETLMRTLAQAASARGARIAFTGTAAGALLAPFVRGLGAVSAYVADEASAAALAQAMELRPVEEGANLTLLIPEDAGVFYRSQTIDGQPVVGPVQAYLDLAADPARGREQADFLRQQLLHY
jgi:hypothetical protein